MSCLEESPLRVVRVGVRLATKAFNCEIPFSMSPLLVAVALVLCLGTSMQTRADSAWKPSRQLHINGYALHITNDDDVNEFVVGLGLTWDIKRVDIDWLNLTDVVIAFDGDVLKDSNYEWSVGVGVSLRKSVGVFEVGALAGLTYKKNLQEDSGFPIFPYVLPFIQSNLDHRLNVRVVWIPPVRKSTDNQLVFQLLVDF